MDRVVITGGIPLRGEVQISGAKNATLPILASTMLGGGECVITNVPRVVDVLTMGKLLGILGAKVHHEGNRALINAEVITSTQAPYDLVNTMRASVLVLGRCWRDGEKPRCRCQVAARLGHGPSISIWPDWLKWVRKFRWNTGIFTPKRSG